MDMSSPIPDCKFPKDRNQALLYIFLCPQNLVFVLYLLNGKWCIESKLKVDRVHIVIETDRSGRVEGGAGRRGQYKMQLSLGSPLNVRRGLCTREGRD